MSAATRIGPAGVKMGLFVVVTLVCTGVLAITMSNMTFTPKQTYQGVFVNAVGVAKDDDVRMAGVRIGSVDDVELYENQHALVTFSVDEDVPLAKSTQLDIRYRNLIGQRYLSVSDAAGDGTLLQPGDVIPMSQTEPSLNLTVLFDGFKPLLEALSPDDVNTLAYELVRVLQGEGGTVTTLLGHLSSLTGTLADRDVLIGQVIDNLNGVLGPLDAHSAQLSALIVNLRDFLGGLAQDREAIGSSLASLADLTNTTAGLLDEGRPALKTDIAELGQAAAGLNTPTNRDLITKNLHELPNKLRITAPLVSYGSWINFYLCAVNFKIGPDTDDQTPVTLAAAPRCAL